MVLARLSPYPFREEVRAREGHGEEELAEREPETELHELLHRVSTGQYMPTLPPGSTLHDIVLECCQRNPERRLNTAELIERLSAAASSYERPKQKARIDQEDGE